MAYQPVQIETDDLEGATLSGEITVVDDNISTDSKTLVVLLHDFPYSDKNDHDDFYRGLGDIFAAHGLQSLLFDFQSCGDSEGAEEEFTLIAARENFARVLTWARRRGFEHFIFVASGASAALTLEKSDENTKMMFWFWPAIDLAAYAKHLFYEADGTTVAAKGRKLGRDLLTQMASYDPAKAMKSLKVPVLIQYGLQDELVGTGQIDLIKRGFNALRLDITSYADGGYGLPDPRHRKMAAHHIGQFLQKYA